MESATDACVGDEASSNGSGDEGAVTRMTALMPRLSRLRRPLSGLATMGLAYILLLGLGRLAGFARESLIAYFFGATHATDAYYGGTALPELASGILLSGLLGYVVIPAYTALKQTREDSAAEMLLGSILVQVVVLCGLLSLATVVAAGPIVSLVAPGLSGAAHQEAVSVLMVASPAVLGFGIASVAAAALNVRGSFLSAPASLLIGNLAAVAVLLTLHAEGAMATAWAYLVGGLTTAGAQLAWLGLTRVRIVPSFRLGSLERGILATGALATVVTSLPYVRFLAERVIASTLGSGQLAAFGFATKIVLLAAAVIAVPLGTVAFPGLAEHAARGDRPAFHRTLRRAVLLALGVSLPVTAVLAVGANLIVRTLLQHGAFDQHAAALTASALRLYALGIGGMAISEILIRALFASHLGRTSLYLVSAVTAATVGFQVLLSRLIGLDGIALGAATGIWAGAAVLAVTTLKAGGAGRGAGGRMGGQPLGGGPVE